ncbi:hypothetical protein [Paenibacillus sp. NPDC058177]|uniref:hypothetical protein n=1 Tax=Paenibacillus sp. NPDC058177 TaxID=3346369 RepID=UPI0036D784B6
MKKFISGIIVGVLLFAGVTAFADSSSLIGQKVQGLFLIEKGGAKVADAVIINGSAYAPVRAVAEATGASLKVEGKKIIMGDTTTASVSASSSVVSGSIDELKTSRQNIVEAISKKESHIAEFKKSQVDMWDVLISENPNSTTIPQWEGAKKESEKILNQLRAELATLQQQLADVDAKIAGLQK